MPLRDTRMFLGHHPEETSPPARARPSWWHTRIMLAFMFVILGGCAAGARPQEPSTPTPAEPLGVLVMAHGGSEQWNAGVESAVAPLRDGVPLEIAFGMASPSSIQTAVTKLEDRGVRRIAVVRLFVSGESWMERTEQILGIRPGAPQRDPKTINNTPAAHAGHDMSLWKIKTKSTFALTTTGLADAPEIDEVLLARVEGLSRDPAREDVIILAHGPGDDSENERWIALLNQRSEVFRSRHPFRRVEVQTLREDWPEKREASEKRIRAFVERAKADDGEAIVVPFRVHGFGPYSDVLEGLEYRSDGVGLLPHPNVTLWIERQVESLRAGSFRRP